MRRRWVLDALLRNADATESDDGDAEELEAVLGNDYPVDAGALLATLHGLATQAVLRGKPGLAILVLQRAVL